MQIPFYRFPMAESDDQVLMGEYFKYKRSNIRLLFMMKDKNMTVLIPDIDLADFFRIKNIDDVLKSIPNAKVHYLDRHFNGGDSIPESKFNGIEKYTALQVIEECRDGTSTYKEREKWLVDMCFPFATKHSRIDDVDKYMKTKNKQIQKGVL